LHTLAKKVNRCWRWFATALSFSIFGLGSLVLGMLIMPVCCWYWGNTADRPLKVRRLIGGATDVFRCLMKTLGVLDYRVERESHPDGTEPFLIVANHPSLIDVVFLLAEFPESQCVVKRALWTNPFTHMLFRYSGYISNDDPETLLTESVAAMKNGDSLILFPEGTRTRAGCDPEFKAGAAAIAVRAGRSVLPILILVTPTTLTKADHWYSVPEEKVFVDITVCEPLSVTDATGVPDERQAIRQFNKRLQQWYCERLEAKGC